MKTEKRKHRRLKKPVKILLIFSSFLLVFAMSVGVTYAYLLTKTDGIVNTFVPASADIDTEEKFENDVKENVKIENTGSTSVFIRAAVIITWKNAEGETYPVAPVKDKDYTITMYEGNNWFEYNGFYYCSEEVEPGKSTPVLIKECKTDNTTTPEGYGLNVEIISSSIQSMPRTTVTEAWGVYSSSDGKLRPTPWNS